MRSIVFGVIKHRLRLHLPTAVTKERAVSAIGRRYLLLALAALVSPLSAGFLLLGISAFENIGEGIWALRVSALVGYPAMFVLGLPAHLFLKRIGWTNIWGYLIAGLLVGAVAYIVMFSSVIVNNFHLAADSERSLAPSAAILLLMAFFGGLSSAVFWAIARPDRP